MNDNQISAANDWMRRIGKAHPANDTWHAF